MERESGYYWVINHPGNDWEVALYNQPLDVWHLAGSEMEWFPHKVNWNRIMSPDEQVITLNTGIVNSDEIEKGMQTAGREYSMTDPDRWGNVTIKIGSKVLTGVTSVKYNPDGSKTVTTGLPAKGDPVFDASNPDFIPFVKD